MSLCRKEPGHSDLYVYESGNGFVCQWCILGKDFEGDAAAMTRHVQEHEKAGHVVPAGLVDAIEGRSVL